MSKIAPTTGALATLQVALDVRRSILGSDHPDTAVTLRVLAKVLRHLGREVEACHAVSAALPVFERCMGGDHPWTLQVREEAAPCLEASTLLEVR